MSHEIEMVNGQAQMAYVGETPWHGLGVKLPADVSPRQMQMAAGLDWKVLQQDIVTDTGIAIPGKKALVRDMDSKVLDIVGTDWKPVQNDEAFDFFSEFCAAGDMEMHTAGSLHEGRMTWVLAKIKESFDVLGKDQVDSYLLFSNPHSYGKSIDIRFTPIRVVCNNTLTMSLQSESKNKVNVNHRREFVADEVKLALGIATEQLAKYKEVAEFLAKAPIKMESYLQYLNDVFPKATGKSAVSTADDLSKNAKLAHDSLETQPGAELFEGTWWSAFNSVTYITDHLMSKKAETRLRSAWFGSNQVRKVQALNKAVEYAEAA